MGVGVCGWVWVCGCVSVVCIKSIPFLACVSLLTCVMFFITRLNLITYGILTVLPGRPSPASFLSFSCVHHCIGLCCVLFTFVYSPCLFSVVCTQSSSVGQRSLCCMKETLYSQLCQLTLMYRDFRRCLSLRL